LSMAEKAKRYLVFLFGLFISSLGVSMITKADLGTSPISAIPYVLSLNFPWTLGGFTVAFSLFLILLQLLILRKNFKLEHLLQIPISIAFGWFIDLTMVWLSFLAPQAYPVKLLSLLAGCVVLAFGVYLEVLADVAMLPGESFVRAVVMTWKTEFGTTKVCFDVSITAVAVVVSFVVSGKLAGVREGTLIAALVVGFIARIMEYDHCDAAGARASMAKGDRKRATYYQYYTRRVWGLARNFHISVDTTLGYDYARETIAGALRTIQDNLAARV